MPALDDHRQVHVNAEVHHHHSHASLSKHTCGHHLLLVEDLSISFKMYDSSQSGYFFAPKRDVHVIHNLSVGIHAGEIVAVVGASGSGKTLLADAIMGIYEPNATVQGSIWFDGVKQTAESLAGLRGKAIALLPQSVNYLDPLLKVGAQISVNKKEAGVGDLLHRYGLAPQVADLYPHQLSGGMARRVLLCCALIDQPRVIIADEPTPGLDLQMAKKALGDFREFANQGNGVLLITHDIELALDVADRVAVFLDGTVVEETAVSNFASPDKLEHPFSRALWHALPEHDFAFIQSGSGQKPLSDEVV